MKKFEINGKEFRAYPNDVGEDGIKTFRIVKVVEQVVGMNWTSKTLKEKIDKLKGAKESIEEEIEITEFLESEAKKLESEV